MEKRINRFTLFLLGVIMIVVSLMAFSIPSFNRVKAETSYEARIGETKYETFENAVQFVNSSNENDLVIDILSDITLESSASDGSALHITNSVKINGNGKKITLSTNKGIRLYGGETEQDKETFVFNNLTVYNPTGYISTTQSGCRGIETRGGYMAVALNGVDIVTDSINSQPITIGGDHAGGYAIDFNVNGGEIFCGNEKGYGYGIITFNPVNLTVDGVKFTTWSAFYAKTPNSSYGARGTVATYKNCEIKAINPSLEPSNSFATFVIQDDEVTLNIENCKINQVYPEGQSQGVVAFDAVKDKNGNVTSEAKNGKVTISGDTVITGAIEGEIIIDESQNKENGAAIEGGKFDAPVPQQYIATGSTVNDKGVVVTVDKLRSDAANALNHEKVVVFSVNGYTEENKAAIESYYSIALTAIGSANDAAAVAQAIASFKASVAAVEFITFDEFKAQTLEALQTEYDALVNGNTYSAENSDILKARFKTAKSRLDSATSCSEMENILAAFKEEAGNIEAVNVELIVTIILICVGVIALCVAAFFVVKAVKKYRARKAEEAEYEEESTEEIAPVVEEKAEETVPVEDDSVATVEEDRAEIAEEGAPVEESKRSDTTEEEFKALPKAKTFEEKLAAGDEKTKEAYEAITEKLNGYKKVKSRRSRRAETYKVGRAHIVKLQFSGKSIRCYLALNPADYDEKKLKHKDMSNKRSCVKTPMMMKLRSKKAIKNTLVLIDEIAAKLELKPKKK